MSTGGTVWVIIVSVALGMFLGQRYLCENNSAESVTTQQDTTTVVVYDTISRSGGWIGSELVERERPLTAILHIDTGAIIEQYFEKRKYQTEYRDSSLLIKLEPMVSENNLDSIHVDYTFTRSMLNQLVHLRDVSEHPEWSFYGGLATYLHPEHNSFLPTIQAEYRDGMLLGLGVNPWSDMLGFHVSLTFKLFDIK